MRSLPDLRGLLDRQEIVDVLTRYATAIDQKDWALLSTVFVDGADCDYSALGWHRATFPDICEWLADGLSVFVTQHILTNYVIDVEGDEASARTYLQATHTPMEQGRSRELTFRGTYVDRLIRTPVGWRIQRRALYPSDSRLRELG